ncbi:MAG: cupredoxin domain-containing protein [Armatimonadota bacterium]|nr:cupredoxin domain-containing protein [Armatimonadota bacterium]MDW8156526.1 cupredoxin domain-containing protein [Armatimonadota bacterium]
MVRRLLLVLWVGVWVASSVAAGPAPRTIRISMTSFKFEPSVIQLRQGERVVLELVNEDTQRPHNIASELFNQTELVVRGEFRQGTTADGRRFVFVDAGKRAEVEIIVPRVAVGQVSFICSVGQHAAQGMTGAFVVRPAQ